MGRTSFSDTKAALTALESSIQRVDSLSKRLQEYTTIDEQVAFVSALDDVIFFLKSFPQISHFFQCLSQRDRLLLLLVIALEQGHILANAKDSGLLKKIVEELFSIHQFYSSLGGLVGYHLQVLQLMRAQLLGQDVGNGASVSEPPIVDIRKRSAEVDTLVMEGLKHLPQMAEIYAVGGAGDRLHLTEEKTGRPLPAARLQFCGRSLLELLVRDLWGREYLYYKLFGIQQCTPVLLMTSLEKANDQEITLICHEHEWFGRPKSAFFTIVQPLVPVLTIDGKWAVDKLMRPLLKPGGHGVIWKLAKDFGGFKWLRHQKRSFVIVRQVNNPVAGEDYGLMALVGFGCQHKKSFGFLSCPTLKGVSEGVNALKKEEEAYCITNVEYTELAKKKEKDPSFAQALENEKFPANTNILFATIEAVERAIDRLPIPGMIVNMKQAYEVEQDGKSVLVPGARLESTMQNIADAIVDILPKSRAEVRVDDLHTFVLLNDRLRTISVAKKAFDSGSFLETPESCFYDLMHARYLLLKQVCDFLLPPLWSKEAFLSDGPSFIFLYHPALGPLYSVIREKVFGGSMSSGSEMQLEIAEVSIKNFMLDGSVLIHAHRIMGYKDDTGLVRFSPHVGRCVLHNVTVHNAGIDRSAENCYWKNQILRKEALHITLEGYSEFIATNVTFKGNFSISVPHGMRATAMQDATEKVTIRYQPL